VKYNEWDSETGKEKEKERGKHKAKAFCQIRNQHKISISQHFRSFLCNMHLMDFLTVQLKKVIFRNIGSELAFLKSQSTIVKK
jgi:hypothetical protein